MWGRVADSRRFGRKTVLLIGLAGTSKTDPRTHHLVAVWLIIFMSSDLVPRIWLFDHLLASPLLQVSRRDHQWERGSVENHVG